jgi:phosphate butyryltransferase
MSALLKTFREILDAAKMATKRTIAVAGADDADVLSAIKDALTQGIADAILVGDAGKIKLLSEGIGFNLNKVEIIDEPDLTCVAKTAVKLVLEKRAQMLMKGKIGTADVLRAVLDKDQGLRTGKLLSHIAILEVPTYHKLLFLSDGAQNIAPDLNQKAMITKNAVDVAKALGVETPKVAIITALELVNPKMPSTVDAYELQKMSLRGEITDCIIHGPLAFDCAISANAARHKGVLSQVTGDVDVLIAPNIETGNALYKALVYLAKAKVAGLITGAAAPVVLTSRSDSSESKLFSIASASIVA